MLVCGFFVYAYVDRTVYTTEQLVIIPGKVTSDTWLGLESVLVQDISEYSLYQDFTQKNSAYISELGLFSSQESENAPTPEVPNEVNSKETASTTFEAIENSDTEPENNTKNAEPPTPSTANESSSEVANPVPASAESESKPPQSEAESQPVSFKSGPSIVWGVFNTAGPYPLAQGIVTEDITQPEAGVISESPVSVEPPVTTDTVVSPEVSIDQSEVASSAAAGVNEETSGTPVESNESGAVLGEMSTETASQTNVQGGYELAPCDVQAGCATHSMIFSDFALPDLEGGSVLDSVQLRLSLAAQTKNNRMDGPQRFLIEYTYDTSTSASAWVKASVLDIDDEISNSINGGYFLFSLNTPQKSGELANLRVKVTYEGKVSDLETAYVEGMWLEVTSGKFFEEGAGEEYSDALTYGRDLLAPELNMLNSSDLDPTLGSLPSFTLSYDPQQGFFNRIFRSLFGSNTFVVEQISLTDSGGEALDVPFAVEYTDQTTWTMRAVQMPQKLRAGKYLVTVDVLENDVRYTDTFEFYWGVLAVNTKKSMYFPNEDVTLNLAALTDKGDTICDAKLELKIIDPKGNISEVPVEQSGACGPNNVTNIPDYLAKFTETGEWGKYTIQLKHLNVDGQVVHKISDSFEVRDYIPFDIERTAPTRIYPPAPYDVTLNVKAYRDFTGDINERVPRGFIIAGLEGAVISTLPEYTLITWKDVTMKEGDELTLSYNFDAPDISPYMYLLGPLDMDGFSEIRQWQIASDALNNIGWFTGTRTVASSSLNTVPSPMQWSTSSVDNYYYTHSTSTNSQRVTLRQSGDYLIAVNLPQQRSDILVSRTRAAVEVRKNGVAIPQGLGRSGVITGGSGVVHSESSSNVSFLLTSVSPDDYIEVFVENLTTIDAGDVINVSGLASMYVEYLSPATTVFAATTTRTTNSTNFNQTTAFPLEWTETRQDAGFVHSNTITPQNITISATGTYMVHINVPLQGTAVQTNISGRVLLDGVVVSGGHFQQGYIDGPASESDADSSIHWSGVVVATTNNQVLTVTTLREANVGTTTVPAGFVGSIMVEKLPTTGVIALRSRGDLTPAGTNFNSATASSTRFNTQLAYDNVVFTHSTTTNNHQITVNESGDYLLNFTDALTSATNNVNNRITVSVGSSTITGAQTKSNYIRALNGHSESSANLVFLLEGVTAGQIVTINTQQEGVVGTLSTTTDATFLLWKKASLNFRAPAPSMFSVPFDNIRFASTTPYFDFQSNDPDGTSDIQYEFSISTTSDFATATVRVSGANAGFSNTASSTDTSPFIEANKVRFQLQPADVLLDLTTYYWRVRAKDVNGSGEFGDYSTTQSLTVNLSDIVPNWYQNLNGQFKSNTLIGAVSPGVNNSVTVDAAVSTEIIVGYGDGTSATPKYRLWNGISWDAEQSAVAVGGTINWVRTAASVSRNEYMMLTIDQSSAAYAQVYSASSSSWGNRTLLSSTVSNVTRRGLAVGYESMSGDAMAVSCSNGAGPVYRIWNGSSWSATTSITVSSVSVCNYLEIASDPASDELILVVRDGGATLQYEALVWNGNAWIANRVIGAGQVGQEGRAGIGLKYESSGDQAIIAVTNGAANNLIYTTWNGTSFTVNATQALGDDFEFGNLAADPNSDNMALCYIDADADIGVVRWNGGIWSTFFEQDIAGNSEAARPIDCEFETTAGRTGNILMSYSDTVGARYSVFNYASSSWSAEQSITGIGTAGLFWGQTERAGDGTIVSMWHDDVAAGDELESSYWNGTSWAIKQTIAPNPSSIIGIPFETFEMAAKRFQFTQGVVRSTPINFSAVPNQPTWGDLSFASTEPFGTDVLIRLRYTSTSTCDSYVPDGALLGNSAGFGTGSMPLVLTGLSTTTYSQICLEATLTTLGSASASLDDWSVSWLRKPKLIQSTYRWYDNGSFLTPIDPWPLGVTDIAENTPLSSSESVNINDVIRLRLSLEGANVTLPTSTAAFKLQYADGLSCSAITEWTDIGAVGSSTALWRGYANAIVGADWLSASWLRRSKITIKGTLVNGAQTDFPVYVNLDDLPDSFFASVQSDGDDIRITTSNGLTEVPFELVSIDTIAKIGELHFKATLASTTDTDFFIYYGNSGASGYGPTATYGRNNVWTNGYQAVYHLGTDPSATMTDSTVNGRNLTSVGGMTAGNSTSSPVGKGVTFDGVNDRFTNAAFAWSSAPVTVTAWSRVNTSEVQNSNLFGFTAAGSERLATHAPWSDNTIYWDYGTCCAVPGRISANYTAYRDKWTHIGLVSAGGAGAFMGIYLDGALITSITNSDNPPTLTGLAIGSTDPAGGAFHRGRIDEFRIASVARAAGFISTERTNQSNPTGFYALSAEEFVGDGAALPSTVLTGSDNAETYEEGNPTNSNRKALPVGNAAEWDFTIQNNAALPNTNYCFRMVYTDGSTLSDYQQFPRLITNSPPLVPVLSAPFDNEQFSSTTPWFEFAAQDEVSDEVSYEIMVDTDYAFGSPDLTNESNANFALFTNLASPSERGLYTTGQTIRFIPSSALTTGNTYWWRVRAKDDNGSGTYSDWSVPSSFTIASGTLITTWFQTTGEQFTTGNLLDVTAGTSSNDVGINTGFTAGTTTTTVIDYDDRDVGNAWGELSFAQNVTSGTIRHYVEYRVSGENFALVPDSLIAGNSTGLTASPVALGTLDTTLYNELRITSVFSGTPTLPRLLSMTLIWGQTIEIPIHVTPFDNAKVATTTPAFTFSTTDPQSDSLEYEFQYSSTADFVSSSTFNSGSNAGFVNTASSSDITPFVSGNVVRYTLNSSLTNGSTYWWRVRARDPLGTNAWSQYSQPESITVDTSILVSVWHQTTGEQFLTNTNQDIETTLGGAQITSVVSGVMAAYGEGTGQAPQFRLWNGTSWNNAASADTVGAQIRWTRLDASPTRPEYALATLGTDLDINIQIYDGVSESWNNMYEIYTEATDAIKRRFDIEYETTSGDLLAVACEGTEARFSIWNGTVWSASTSLPLSNVNNCEWVELAADPVSDEIIAVFRHTNTGATDYEALVWNGSSFSNSLTFGNINENSNEGIALNYEASGGQALAVVSNDTLASFIFSSWNGSSWTTPTSSAISNDFEWGSLKRDVGTDNLIFCYIDDVIDIGVKTWNGSAWSASTLMTIDGNSKLGQPVDCEYQTLKGVDGDVIIPYSDTIVARYQQYTTATGTFSGEFSLDTVNDSWSLQTVRGGDGTIHTFAFDDGSAPDRYSTSQWNGNAWSTLFNFSTSPSITAQPYNGSITAAAQIYPNFTNGTIRSTPIDFADGSGPRWERISWNDSTPAASDVRYRLYYQTTPGVFVLVPDVALAGNSTGFTSSPVSIAALDRTVYSVLKLEAELLCNSGTCPTVQDWSLEWSQGINVSGTAYEYDASTTVATGTVAVAVNGILQSGKTAVISGAGTWTIPNVTAFVGDAITVFIDGVNDSDEAVGVTTYDGVGDVTQMELNKRHLTFGSTDNATSSNALFGAFDSSDDEDVFFTVSGSSTLALCVEAACADAKLKIKTTAVYMPGANISVHDIVNQGRFLPETNTVRVSGSWLNTGTFIPSLSTVIFSATTSSETITSTSSATSTFFHNVTFGETAGSATWSANKPLDITGTLVVDFGTFARGTTTINLEQNLRIGTGGFLTGLGTTTFDGSGTHIWTDNSASSTNIGFAVIDGAAKTITLGGNVAAESVTIGADDTLNASGSGFNINVYKTWTNNNSFIPQSGTVTFVGTSTGTIARGTSAFNNVTFSGIGANWSFTTATLAVNNNFTIAMGTVTLPTGTTTIGGNFANVGGTFLHNNGEVRMTSAATGKTIIQKGSAFLNAFYDLVFAGSGAWSFAESAATTTRNLNIQSGTVTLASSTLTVGGDFTVTGAGAFNHNSGELVLLVQNTNSLRANGSAINNLRIRGLAASSWYNDSWSARQPIVINSAQVPTTVTDFPVYVNLANLPTTFFSSVNASGTDIRVTTSDGLTEVPYELVAIDTVAKTGELHFKAPTVSSSTNTTFYIYYGNGTASAYSATSTFGRNNVWTNGFEAVYHLGTNPTSVLVDSTVNGRNLTSAGGMGAGNSVAGIIGNSIDFDGVNDTLTNGTYSWTSTPVTVTAWSNVAVSEVKVASMFGFNAGAGDDRFAAHAPYSDNTLYWDYGNCCGATGRITAGYTAYRDKWTHVGLVSAGGAGAFMGIYLDGAQITTGAASDDPAVITGFAIGAAGSGGGGGFHDGRVDEFRLASVARTFGWIATEENNQSSSTAFYSVGAAQSRTVRVFTDTNTTILGNYVSELGGDATFPTGVLGVAGSFTNVASFGANNGTVRFNSTGGAETIAVGSSTFATLEFNSASGIFTVTQNATATVAINLTSASAFTLQSGLTLAALGTFSNAATASSTTWTGSTLSLSGVDAAINLKSHSGDAYATILTNGDTDMTMWNSTATTYSTASTSSIYSADHAAVDGDLNIYGDYVRTTGTEYWSFATDFDGAALTGTTSRQVDVRIASSSKVGLTSASLNLVGGASASTTIDAISGTFTLSATTSTITAQNFTVTGIDASGLRLNASTTLAIFQDGFFNVVPGHTGITISSTTVAQNPSAQYFGIGFATSSVGGGTNVTLTGTTSSFVWFRLGTGNLYGEAYDGGDANPGSVRWDDSSNSITISGVVYADDGITPLSSPTCDGTTPNVRVVVNNGTFTASTTCAAGTGTYTLAGVNYIGDPKITVYLNTNGGVNGSVVTKTPSGNITNMNIYAGRVITRHQDIAPLTIADMTSFDNDDDSDIQFVATTTGVTALRVLAPNSLFVFATTTFAPGGNVTLHGNASTSAIEGTLQLGTAATFTASGTETHTLAGRLLLATTSVLTSASSTFIFNASTTGKSITSPNTVTFNAVQFTGVGGGWNITAPLIVNGNMDVATGTVTGTSNVTLTNGSLSGEGTLSFGSGTTTINRTNTLGGTRAWTFNNLVLGSGLVAGTTTRASVATTTILGRLTISPAHFLVAGNSNWDLAGAGTVFVEGGTLQEDTSTFRYSGAGAQVLSTTYYNLDINAGAGTPTYTPTGVGIAVTNNLTIGGTAATTFDVNSSDPALLVGGSVSIRSNGTFSASNIATTSVGSNWTNFGTFISNGGLVAMVGAGSNTVAAGNGSFGSLLINNGAGNFTMSQNATTTVALTLLNHTNFTQASGTTMAIGGAFTNTLGGAATTFASSTLSFFGGGTKNINAKTVGDVYATLFVASSTNVKMWNSSASTYAALGSIYSQDHAAVDGTLNIYGTYTVVTGNDYWSYATDFDGVALGGGARKVDVSLASGSSASYAGGSLEVIGTSTASTTITNQGAGTYGLTLSGTASTTWDTVLVRNMNASGVVFTGTPLVANFSRTDHLIGVNGGTGITVNGTVIDANQAKNFTNNVFASSSGVTGATNVTATGTSISSWRFTNHTGLLSGEAYDNDPAGDPGYVVWDDSAALITVSGNVYSDEGVTVSPVCNGVTQNILLRVAGLTTYTASCNAGTGAYSIPNVAFSPADTLSVYIDNNIRKAVTVSADPVSSISNMNLYENRVIVRHENTSPLSIADMAIWDSSDDGDILFTAVDAGIDTLSLPADQKLLIWSGKTFEPAGNVTVAGGGGGAAQDGTLEAQTNATFRALGTESHTIGGSMIFGTGALFTAGQSTTTFTTTGAGRTIDVNSNTFYNIAFTGAGSWDITDAIFTTSRSFVQSNGAITFGSGTTTIGASFNATAGAFTMGGTALLFTSTTTGNIVRFDDSVVPSVRFQGIGGSWSMADSNATTTGNFRIASGTVTLPSGNLGVGASFENLTGTIVHNTADIIMSATSTASLKASSSNLFAVRFTGVGPFTMSDVNLTLADSLTMATGTLTLATGTLSVGGDFLIASGTVNNASGTVLFNATSVGKTVNFGTNNLYSVVFGSATGGWNFVGNATTTNNFSITGASTFTKEPNTILNVGGVFTNTVGGANTTWATSTLKLSGVSDYTINTKTLGGDVYGTLEIVSPLAIRAWNSSAATTTVLGSASFYSQDHAGVDGSLTIYGNVTIATTTEYWNYANDFDGTVLAGASLRQVNVRMAAGASTTVTTGSLQILGTTATSTTVAALFGGSYGLTVNGGTLNAQYYTMTNLGAGGLTLTGSPTITNLSNGSYILTSAGGSLISVAASVLDANASKVFTNVGFATSSAITGFNVNLTGSTSNAWRFNGSFGNIGGEAFDIDGVTACGSIRFDNSGCLLTQQTHYRWRNDDGGEGATASEWFNTSFDYRQRVRVINSDTSSYASSAIKINVAYDSNMQADFDDLRFTSSDGLTQIPYWIERYTASTDAVVWIRVPNLPASETATTFMYYGSSTAANTSSGATTFAAFDDFEDNNITEYSGDTSLFQTDTAPVYGGTYSLEAQNKSGRTTDGIFRTTMTVSQGQIIRWMQYIDTAGSGDDACTLFGVQSPGVNNNNYAICLQQFGIDRMVIAKNIYDNDSSGTVLASSTVTYATGWYEVEVDWRTNNSMTAYLRTAAGALVATASTTDSSYTTGGVGFTFWFQNGSWDSYTARAKAMIAPTVYFGAEQTDGGATWEKLQNVAGSGVTGVNKRLRFAIENSGLDIVNQTFRLEAAPKGAAPSCEAVPTGNFSAVPNQASCGSSPICMQTSTFVADGDASTDHLASTSGAFAAGKVIESPSNITTALNLNQNKYTELEYVLTPTINATSSYCLRVTNGGTPLDFYNKVAEMNLQFDPVFGAVTLNGGLDINLTPGTTTTVFATGTVTDLNGYADIIAGSSTIYRTGAGPSCTANTNNCYKGDTTSSSSCSFINCAGNTCTLSCRADIYFNAEATDAYILPAVNLYEGEKWSAYLEVRDSSGTYDFESAIAQELITLRAASVNNSINYGSLALGGNTGAANASTTVTNVGNIAFNIEVLGTDLSDGGSSRIPANEQRFATSTFTYSGCTACSVMSSTTPTNLAIGLAKPTAPTPPVVVPIYWGVAVPATGVNSAPHSGINVFTPVSI